MCSVKNSYELWAYSGFENTFKSLNPIFLIAFFQFLLMILKKTHTSYGYKHFISIDFKWFLRGIDFTFKIHVCFGILANDMAQLVVALL